MNKRILKLREKINTCKDLTMLYRYRAQLYNIRNSQLTTADSDLKNYLLLIIKDKLKDNNIIEVSLNLILKEWELIGYAWRDTNLNKKETPDILFYKRDKDDTYYTKTILFCVSTLSYYTNHYVTTEEHRLITKLIKFYKGGKFYA